LPENFIGITKTQLPSKKLFSKDKVRYRKKPTLSSGYGNSLGQGEKLEQDLRLPISLINNYLCYQLAYPNVSSPLEYQ